ncbi:MAG: hypothetical protein HZB83_04810 [Deltaproteobacteria bacterium]|nr:hypothetical protein [Deltaproteobacteria bacterium]
MGSRLNNLYYQIKPLIPRRVQTLLRQRLVSVKRRACADIWPIDKDAGHPQAGFSGWPDNKRFALVLTHDVDSVKGYDRCRQLIKLEEDRGFRSTFNFLAKSYNVAGELRQYLAENGFEVGCHGLNHDGKLYKSREIFMERAVEINRFLKEWNAVGFRSPSMHSNLEWIHDLAIEYDSSTFDTDPFEPYAGGVRTVFPFIVRKKSGGNGYVELPYTLPQDFTVFVMMRERNIDIWKAKLDWLAENNGMALLNTHPDYMNFGSERHAEEYPAGYYADFLDYIKNRYKGQYWHVLCKDMAHFWKADSGVKP